MTTERGPRGGRLVLVDEDGTRLGDLTPIEPVEVIDSNPAWSPDGRWVVFASTRDRRELVESSLWVVSTAADRGPPVRLTRGASVDRDPRFTADGEAIVYSSNTGDGTFDLWLLPLRAGDGPPRAAGKARRLTRTRERDELAAWPRPDGRAVVYTAIERASNKAALWSVPLAGGDPQRLTEGPFDVTPSVSPDGKTIAFAAPVKDRGDIDLFAIDADGSNRRVLVDDPVGDETGPVWSADGRWVVATSVFRSHDPKHEGQALLSSLVCVDLRESTRALRGLYDPAGASPRIGVALAPHPLDGDRLRQNQQYRDAVKRILKQELERQDEARR